MGPESLDDAKGCHGSCYTLKPCDICAQNIVAKGAVFLGGLGTGIMNVAHDGGEAFLGFLEAPAIARGILLHFQG